MKELAIQEEKTQKMYEKREKFIQGLKYVFLVDEFISFFSKKKEQAKTKNSNQENLNS